MTDESTKQPDEITAVREWLDPSPKDLETPEFNAIWDVIKSWDINVPSVYRGYCGATGSHVMQILLALRGLEKKTPVRESDGVAALKNIMGICGDWKKWSSGSKWYWDCDTPDTVRKVYEAAEESLSRIEGGIK